MTPDQTLKAALIGDAPAKREKPARTPRKPRAERRKRSSRAFRWGIKLLMLALTLMISRGLMRTPEVQLMWADVQGAVIEFVQKERAARQAAAVANAEASRETAAGTQMPDSQAKIRRVGTEAQAQVLSGPVEQVFAGSVLMVAETLVLVAGLVCPEPKTDRGEKARQALEGLTRGQDLRCTVIGKSGQAAVTATCLLKGGRDLASAMQADGFCQAG